MLINWCRAGWYRSFAVHLVAFSLIVSVCFPALSEEERSGGEPTEPIGALSSELAPGEPPEPLESTSAKPEQPPPAADWLEREPVLFQAGGEGEALGRTPELNFLDSLKKMAVALLIVIALLCFAIWLFKRVTKGVPLFLDQNVGRVIGRIYLSPKAILYIVKIADRILIVGANPTAINLITEIADPVIVKEMERTRLEGRPTRSPFASYMSQFHDRFSGPKQASEEDAKLEEHLRDIKDQMAKLSALIGGTKDEEEL